MAHIAKVIKSKKIWKWASLCSSQTLWFSRHCHNSQEFFTCLMKSISCNSLRRYPQVKWRNLFLNPIIEIHDQGNNLSKGKTDRQTQSTRSSSRLKKFQWLTRPAICLLKLRSTWGIDCTTAAFVTMGRWLGTGQNWSSTYNGSSSHTGCETLIQWLCWHFGTIQGVQWLQ